LAKFPFLSPEWIEEARRLRQSHSEEEPAIATNIRMNQIVTEIPFGEGELHIYVDTSQGFLDMEIGELDNPDITIALDYATAKALFVEMNPQAGIEAFMAGKIRVTGDMTKLMSLQGAMPQSGTDIIGQKIKDMTE
jgi:putative sterol carrier protein